MRWLAAIALVAACGGSDDVSVGRIDSPSCAGSVCQVDQFCSLTIADCSSTPVDPMIGPCKKRPIGCSDRPEEIVCGCNGTSYRNACAAAGDGVGVLSMGACP